MKTNKVVIVAILSLVVVQIAAMYYGINGTFRTMIVGAIAGLAGWRIPNEKNSLEVKL